jgi:hypothetical protein
MGIRLASSPHLVRLMNPEDQARYGALPGTVPPRLDRPSSPKTSAAERKEQACFANWRVFLVLPSNRC